MQTLYSNGKLLLTAEYAVLDGATALALPTKFGQTLIIEPLNTSEIHWKSLDYNNNIWFEKRLPLNDFNSVIIDEYDSVLNQLVKILITAKQLNPNFLNTSTGYSITTKLDFNKNWGLGSSSTLINNIANWAKIDAFELLNRTFGGSGYDVACAQHDSAILYKTTNTIRIVEDVCFKPTFSNHLYFVYLNSKRNSRRAIETYRKHHKELRNDVILQLNDITKSILDCNSLEVFCSLIDQHEDVIADLIKEKPIKKSIFSDFNGSIKSLGAWGGDFILVASEANQANYFKSLGYHTILSFNDMIL